MLSILVAGATISLPYIRRAPPTPPSSKNPTPTRPRTSAPPPPSVNGKPCWPKAIRYHLQGNFREAERLYRQAKPEFPAEGTVQIAEAITEDQLSPAGRVYWNNVQEGLAEDRESQVEASLDLLFEEAPGFAPPYTLIAQRYLDEGDTDEAIAFLEEATTRFPGSYELARMLAETLRADGQRLEASIAAREFAIVNPDHPQAGEMTELADRYLGQFRGRLRGKHRPTGIRWLSRGGLNRTYYFHRVSGYQPGPVNDCRGITPRGPNLATVTGSTADGQ